jgi:deoxyribonuclease-4
MRIGLYVSISGRIYESLDRVKTLGCNAMQIFSRNPRIWLKRGLEAEDASEFRRRAARLGIWPVAVHILYLVNLASPDRSVTKR